MRRPSSPAEGEAQTGPLILYSLLAGGLAGGAALLASLALKAVEVQVGGLLGYLPPGPPGEGGLGQAFTGPSSPLLPLLLLPALFALSGWLASLPGAFPRARAYLAALVQLGAYSPLGREGLFGGLGLWVGEVLGKRFSRIGRVLAFAGLAAGLGASLHAPVAGALLATEMRYRGLRLEAQALAPALLGALAAGSLTALTDDDALRNLHGWHWSVGGGVSPTFDADRWDDAEVDRAFGALESAGVPLLECLKCLGDAYSFSYVHPAPQRVPFTLDGARRFLAGLTWAFSHRGGEGVREASRALAAGLTVAHVTAALKDLPIERGPRVDYHVLDLLTVVAAQVFRHDLTKVVAALCRVPDAWRNGVGSRLEHAVKWVRSESAEPDVFATMIALESGARGEIDFYVRRALG